MMDDQTMIDGPSGPGSFRLIACPTLCHELREDRYCPVGGTVGSSLRELGWRTEGLHARVSIDGQYIPEAEWETIAPRAGQAVVVRRIPRGGGGGGGKQIAKILGFVALLAATWWVGGGALAGLFPEALQMVGTGLHQALAATVLVGGSLALNALIPPSRPRLGALSGAGNSSSTLSLTGSSNQIAPYARIPRVYGTHRVYPPLATHPFTEIVGSSQFIRLLFCFGYGPLNLTDIRIGETSIEQFTDYQMEIRQGYPGDPPLTLAPDDAHEEGLSIKLTSAASWQQRTSEDNAKELSVDIVFPDGLVFIGPETGSFELRTVTVEVEYRKVGDSSWLPASGQVAATASGQTNFSGANNDLVFTFTTAGSAGNAYSIRFDLGAAASVGVYQNIINTREGPKVFPGKIIAITVTGATTSAQVKAAVEANADATALVTVTHAPSNDGTGAVVLPLESWNERFQTFGATYQLSGGRDQVPAFVVTGASQTLVRRSIRWIVTEPGHAFEVQVRRVTPDEPQGAYRDEVFWTMLRTIQTSSPVQKTGLCLLALRIKATDQLNGTVDTLNAVATSILPDWDGTSWIPRETNNPASVYRDVLQGSANRRPKTDAQLDLATIQDFHARCAAQNFMFNAVIDFQTTVKQLRQDVLAAGRGAFGLRDMKYSVIQDLVQAAPVDLITPRTTSGFKWTRRFLELPHAFRVRFVDEDSNWKQKERIVYADGYSESNATVFEDAEAGLGVTNTTQVWALKRRELAEAQLRADDYEVTMDFANINVTRGDRVQLQHDVILAGLCTARIKSVILNGGSEATAITFDEPLVMGAGIDYAARIRKANGAQLVQSLVTVVGEQTGVTFTVPIAAGSVPAVGDLVSFGELGQETIDCIVKEIEPGQDFTATVKLLDYAPAIQTADTAAIPPYDPQITLPSAVTTPTIVQVLSDESVLVRNIDGSLDSRIVISVHFSSAFKLPVSRLETQFRALESDDDWKVIFSQILGGSVEVPLAPVQEGLTYEIRIRSVDDRTGQLSAWTTPITHLVIGKSSPPADVPMLVLEGTRLRWNYSNPPRDLAGFLVRFRSGTSRDWETATPAHDQIILTTDFVVLQQASVQTYLVKAVDTSGNASVNPATITIDFGNQILSNVVVQIDHRALGWPGTITNGTVISGDLKAGSSSPFWTADTDLAWPLAAGDLYWVGSYGDMTYEWSVSPTLDLLDAVLKLDIQAQGDWRVDYRTDSTVLMWNADATTAMWNANASTLMWSAKGDYLAWPGQADPILYQQYDFRFTGQSGGMQSVLEQLKVIFDVDDLVETFSNLALAGGGTRLTLTQTYRGIVIVHVDLIDDGGSAVYTKVMDKNVSLGPLIQAFDSSNAGVAAHADVTVQGY